MRVYIPKDNPNMTCSPAAITVHGQQPAGPRSTIQTRRHSSPQSPSIAAHQEPPPQSWSTTTTTISPHDTDSATLDPPPRPPMRDPQTPIHGAATEALDLRWGMVSVGYRREGVEMGSSELGLGTGTRGASARPEKERYAAKRMMICV
ncbi:unnamed protein product [Pleuronectes platessa]|uniref:Uncharacterized protein n=1 Tax=Pleuronectes platessa TaxID=8262 RepID=A0A9N7VJM6_PLEPL|nr:unnamed protein product [Pleuronectes platessa]